jgi:hypothetical protein
MTFAAYELSAAAGEPVLLFDFSVGLAHWRYTTADRPITYAANVYAPLAITAGAVNQGTEIKKKTLAITVPANATIVPLLQTYPPSSDVLITIYSLHQTDPDLQALTAFVGRVMSQSQAGATVTISAEPAYTAVKATGLRRRWQLNCAHVLYGVGCGVSPATYRVAGVLTAVAGPVITVSGLVLPAAGLQWPGGYVEWASGFGYDERRSINGAAGSVLTLSYPSPDLAIGLHANFYPGCDHSTGNCEAFNLPPQDPTNGNILNYGGQPWIPAVNPMTGNPIY